MRSTNLLVSLMLLLASEAHAFEPNGLIVFLSDFGVKADAVAICKGVMLSHDRELRIIDLTHEVDPFNVREAAFYLNEAVEYFPPPEPFSWASSTPAWARTAAPSCSRPRISG